MLVYNQMNKMVLDIIQNNIFIQSIGFLSMIFSLMVFQLNNHRRMIEVHSLASFLHFVHLYLLGGITGAIVSLIVVVRNLLFIKFKKNKKASFLPYIFIGLFLGLGLINLADWVELLPVMGAVLGTIGYWQNKPKIVRLIALFVAPLWFIYGFSQGSYSTMITEVILFGSDIVGIIRHDSSKKKKKLLDYLPFKIIQ